MFPQVLKSTVILPRIVVFNGGYAVATVPVDDVYVFHLDGPPVNAFVDNA